VHHIHGPAGRELDRVHVDASDGRAGAFDQIEKRSPDLPKAHDDD
jgi:hypothetical protein